MADKVKIPTRNKVIGMLKTGLGFPDLSTNQLRTKVASLSQTAVKGAIRKSGLKGAALMAAFDVAMKFAPTQTGEGKGVDPLNLFGPKRKKVDKAAVKEANEFKKDSKDIPLDAVKKSLRPKSRPSKLAPKESVRPKARNLNMGGMTKAKPRTGSTDYRMGGMFMKKGNK